MIILSKKKIMYIIICLVLSITFYGLKDHNDRNLKMVSTTPVTNKVIILDAGHGGEDGGAVSKNGVSEADINLKITLKVQKLLEQSGTTVILTRSDGNAIYDIDSKTLREKKKSDIMNRVKIGNDSNADAFISIHLNKIPQEQYYGWQTFFKNNNEESKRLAECIQNSLNNVIQRENKRVSQKISGIYIVDNVEIPIAIVECGFLSNEQEEKLLQQEEYQDKLAWGIYLGIVEYCY